MPYQPHHSLLKDKVILVTGAGDGIGRVAATSYAAHGATVILLGKTVSKLESVYDEIVAAGYPEPGIAPMDLATRDTKDMHELFDVILDRYGRLDGLLHNAAILGERVPIQNYDVNIWARVMQVNFTNTCLLTRVMLPLLHKAPNASLIFTSSGVGKNPRAYWGAYAVSKYALEGYAKLLAEEMENTAKIRVNILNPGATRTRMRAAAYPTEDPMALMVPEQLMPLYLFLMGDESLEEKGKTFTREWLVE